MILWEESEKLFNKNRKNFRRVDDILVLCECCGSVRKVKFVTWKNQIRINGSDLCSSCRAKDNRSKYKESYEISDKNRSKSISKKMKEIWSDNVSRQKYLSCNKLSEDEFIAKARKVHGDKYSYDKVEYNGYLSKVKIICNKHGVFWQIPAKHLNGYGCKKCGVDKTRLGTADFITKSNEIHGNKYLYDNVEYTNTSNKVEIICHKHGSFMQSPNSHLSGKGCPRCSVVVSSGHNEIVDFIKSVYDGDVIVNDKKQLSGLELDIFIPAKKFAIEYNGLYWHSFNKNETIEEKNRHLNKRNKCVDAGINVFFIWEHAWRDKKDILKSMIKSKLGLNKKIYARNCKIQYIDDCSYKNFMDSNHLQGSVGSLVKIGLLFNDDLVCSISFKKHNKYQWEVSRFATLLGHNVVGGMGKLLNRFCIDYDPTTIMTYASMDYSNGDVYQKVGFDIIGLSKPGYFYYKNGIVYSRQKFQKHKLITKLDSFNKDLSESANMFNNGYRRLWNCGNIKLVKKFGGST